MALFQGLTVDYLWNHLYHLAQFFHKNDLIPTILKNFPSLRLWCTSSFHNPWVKMTLICFMCKFRPFLNFGVDQLPAKEGLFQLVLFSLFSLHQPSLLPNSLFLRICNMPCIWVRVMRVRRNKHTSIMASSIDVTRKSSNRNFSILKLVVFLVSFSSHQEAKLSLCFHWVSYQTRVEIHI